VEEAVRTKRWGPGPGKRVSGRESRGFFWRILGKDAPHPTVWISLASNASSILTRMDVDVDDVGEAVMLVPDVGDHRPRDYRAAVADEDSSKANSLGAG
jgi:hypothetical protein